MVDLQEMWEEWESWDRLERLVFGGIVGIILSGFVVMYLVGFVGVADSERVSVESVCELNCGTEGVTQLGELSSDEQAVFIDALGSGRVAGVVDAEYVWYDGNVYEVTAFDSPSENVMVIAFLWGMFSLFSVALMIVPLTADLFGFPMEVDDEGRIE